MGNVGKEELRQKQKWQVEERMATKQKPDGLKLRLEIHFKLSAD